MKQEITYEDYNKVEIKVGTVLRVSKNEKAPQAELFALSPKGILQQNII